MKVFIADILLAAGIAAAVILGSFSAFSQRAEAVQHQVLRLHIPANSDSEYDQQIKLELRDALLNKYGVILSTSSSLSEAENRTEELLPEIEQFCCDFLKGRGAGYSAKAEITDMYFTTREYDRVTLPAGDYRALRITLGSGQGHNWWCIMFPPLCIPCVSEPLKETAESTDTAELSEAEAENVLACFEQPREIKVKFALYEWLKELLEKAE